MSPSRAAHSQEQMKTRSAKRRKLSSVISTSLRTKRPSCLTAVPVKSRRAPGTSSTKPQQTTRTTIIPSATSHPGKTVLEFGSEAIDLEPRSVSSPHIQQKYPKDTVTRTAEAAETVSLRASPPIGDDPAGAGSNEDIHQAGFQSEHPPVRNGDRNGIIWKESSPSTPSRQKWRHSENGEPRLPLTPRQLGLEPPPEPPMGLIYFSPSKRSGRRRGQRAAKSSPPKHQNTAVEDSGLGQASSVGRHASKSSPLKPKVNVSPGA